MDSPRDPASLDRIDLLAAATADHNAAKAARATGQPIPATPYLDELQRRHADMTTTKPAETAGPKRRKATADVRYFHDGRSMPESHKAKLSTLAYFHTAGISSPDSKRLTTAEFVDVLVGLGVAAPTEPGWMVKLPNGKTVECRLEGETAQFETPAAPDPAKPEKVTAPAKARTKKSADLPESLVEGANLLAPKKAPAKKATAAKKTSRQVTPIPKEGSKSRKTA
jgi:hypothetical protein